MGISRRAFLSVFVLTGLAVGLPAAESLLPAPRMALNYRGDEASWEFVNGPWKTNEAGDMICPAESYWSMDTHMAFHKKHAYRDFALRGRWAWRYAGGASVELIVRSLDSRRFYVVRFSGEGGSLPSQDYFLMASVWKGHPDGYRRMLAYRSHVGLYRPRTDPYKWYDVRVECVGPEIIVYFEDNFVLAVRDDEYQAGHVGVSSTEGVSAWKELEIKGQPTPPNVPSSVVEAEVPRQFSVGWNPELSQRQMGDSSTLLPNGEILVGFTGDGEKKWTTRSRDHGLTWDRPVERRFGYYLRSLGELWSVNWERNPNVVWRDQGRNFDELNMDNFWNALSRSRDLGETWSGPAKLNLPFPAGRAYAPIRRKAGSVLIADGATLRELRDGSIGMTGFWRNSPEWQLHLRSGAVHEEPGRWEDVDSEPGGQH